MGHPPNLAKKYVDRGKKFSQEGKLEQAIAAFKKAVVIDSFNPQVFSELGLVYYKKGMLEEAIIEYKRALELGEDSSDIYYRLGCAYYYQGLVDKAITCYQKVLEIDPEFAQAYYGLGIAFETQGKVNEALSVMQKAMTLTSDVKSLIFSPSSYGKKEEEISLKYIAGALFWTLRPFLLSIVSLLERILRRAPKGDLKSYVKAGVDYSRRGMLDKAIDSYQKALAFNPNDFVAHDELGLAYYQQGKLDRAVGEFKKTLEINPDFALAYYHLGCAYYRQKELLAAIQQYKKAIELNPDFAEAYYSLGIAYEGKGLVGESFSAMKKAASLVPDIKSLVPTVRSYQERAREASQEPIAGKGGCTFTIFRLFYLVFLHSLVGLLRFILHRSLDHIGESALYKRIEGMKASLEDYLEELEGK